MPEHNHFVSASSASGNAADPATPAQFSYGYSGPANVTTVHPATIVVGRRVPVHNGQGQGLQNYAIGQTGGVESVTLTTRQIPSHNHLWLASTGQGTSNTPQDNITATPAVVKL